MQYGNGEKNICIKMIYGPKEEYEEKLRIFGEIFVNNNKNKCKIIYKNKEYELKEYIEDIDNNYDQKNLILKLRIFNKIINISNMFCECGSLISIKDISKSKTAYDFDINHFNSSLSLSRGTNLINSDTSVDGIDSTLIPPIVREIQKTNLSNINSKFTSYNNIDSLTTNIHPNSKGLYDIINEIENLILHNEQGINFKEINCKKNEANKLPSAISTIKNINNPYYSLITKILLKTKFIFFFYKFNCY